MAHLSEKHAIAARRRSNMMQERMQQVAGHGSYREVCRRSVTARNSMVMAAPCEQLEADETSICGRDNSLQCHARRTSEEIIQFSRQCEQRVAQTRKKEVQNRRQALALAQERQSRSQVASESAPAQAAQRLRERREKQRRTAEEQLKALLEQQDSSLEAMNIAWMLSPQFQERVKFTPALTRDSAEDKRVQQLLLTPRVGSYYH